MRLALRSVGENPTSGEVSNRADDDDSDHPDGGGGIAGEFENRAHNFLLQSHLRRTGTAAHRSTRHSFKSDTLRYDLQLRGSYLFRFPPRRWLMPRKRSGTHCMVAFGPVPRRNNLNRRGAYICGVDLQLLMELLEPVGLVKRPKTTLP